MQIRDALAQDLEAIQAIYAQHVLHGTGTFEEIPPALEAMQARMEAGQAGLFAWLVAHDATGVLGFGYYGAFRTRSAFRYTVEDSVYVREEARGQGVGKALLSRLMERACAGNYKQMLALIGDSKNAASIGLHASLGFSHQAILPRTGWKFGRWLDVVVMQREL